MKKRALHLVGVPVAEPDAFTLGFRNCNDVVSGVPSQEISPSDLVLIVAEPFKAIPAANRHLSSLAISPLSFK